MRELTCRPTVAIMNEIAERLVRRELEPDEVLRWAGVPAHSVGMTANDGCISFFALICLGMLGFLQYFFFIVEVHWVLQAIGLVCQLPAMYVAVGRYVHQFLRLGRTYYGVTDKRVNVIRGRRLQRVQSIPLHSINDLRVDELPNGSGTIRFGSLDGTLYEAWGKQINKSVMPWMSRALPPGFENIQNVRDVAEIIRESGTADEPATP